MFKDVYLYSYLRYLYRNIFSPNVIKQKLAYSSSLSKEDEKYVIDLKRDGFLKIPNFFTSEEIDEFKENIVSELDALDEKQETEEKMEAVFYEDQRKMVKKDYRYSRLFKLLTFNPKLIKFLKNDRIKSIVSEYYGRECFQYHNTAQKSLPDAPNLLDWHLDDYYPRFKALIYLNDVEVDDGPFSILKETHKLFKDKMKVIHEMHTVNYGEGSIIREGHPILQNHDALPLTGKAGDLLLADVCAFHRGAPIISGKSRYAIFSFYSPDRKEEI